MATHAQGLHEAYDPEWAYDDDLVDDVDAREVTGPWELLALLVLMIAGIGLPGVGWLTGLALVHQSRVWTARDLRVAALGPLPFVAALAGWAATGDHPILLSFGPLPAVLLFGGAIAGVLGGVYLAARAFVLA